MERTKYCNDDHCCGDCEWTLWEPKSEREVGNKLDIVRSFMYNLLLRGDSRLSYLHVFEHPATCAGCRSQVQDGAELEFPMPFVPGSPVGIEDTSLLVDGKLDPQAESVFLQVDYGNGWKFDIQITKSLS